VKGQVTKTVSVSLLGWSLGLAPVAIHECRGGHDAGHAQLRGTALLAIM
jgi:hypothetical protein